MADYPDDPGIDSDETLWRRIPANQVHWDGKLGRHRPQSGMFSDSRDGTPMSATKAKSHPSARDYLINSGYGDHLLIALEVAYVRTLGLNVVSAATSDDPGHVFVSGTKTAAIQKKLARAAKWVVSP